MRARALALGMRAFVAVELPDRGPGADGPRSAPSHFTLRFLGEVPPDRVDGLVDRLRPVGRSVPPFDLEVDGVGAFPSPRSPRVVWRGVRTGRAEIVELARRVRDALGEFVGREDEEEFVPHMTLFRVRSPSDRQAAIELLDGRRPTPPPVRTRVHEFVLKESILGARGAVHRTIATFRLEGTPSGPP